MTSTFFYSLLKALKSETKFDMIHQMEIAVDVKRCVEAGHLKSKQEIQSYLAEGPHPFSLECAGRVMAQVQTGLN